MLSNKPCKLLAFSPLNPMILILSQAENETSTEDVMDWLEHLGIESFRLNGKDLDGSADISFQLSDDHSVFTVNLHESEVSLDQAQAVWYRRWIRDRRHESEDLVVPEASGKLEYDVKRHLTAESRRLSEYLFSQFRYIPWLSDPKTSRVNKLSVLECAKAAGLEIPGTLVTNARKELESFQEQYGQLIAKPISEGQVFVDRSSLHFMYTSILDKATIRTLPQRFYPSLFQEYIQKSFELRIFYLDGQCSCMAIFSQLDPQTKTDFRRYNHSKPNRTVPYKLSSETTHRLNRLMEVLDLATGSIDLIKTPEGREVFLEVNPVGQFGMISLPCNYRLEKKVAYALLRRVKGN